MFEQGLTYFVPPSSSEVLGLILFHWPFLKQMNIIKLAGTWSESHRRSQPFEVTVASPRTSGKMVVIGQHKFRTFWNLLMKTELLSSKTNKPSHRQHLPQNELMKDPCETQMQASWENPPSTASPKCSKHLWESRGKPQGIYGPRTRKSKIANRWGALAGLSRTGAITGRGYGQLWTMSFPNWPAKAPGQDPTSGDTAGSGIKTEQQWCFQTDRACPQKHQLQTFVLTALHPACLCDPAGSLLPWSLSGHSSLLTYLVIILLFNTCHSLRHSFPITLWLHA